MSMFRCIRRDSEHAAPQVTCLDVPSYTCKHARTPGHVLYSTSVLRGCMDDHPPRKECSSHAAEPPVLLAPVQDRLLLRDLGLGITEHGRQNIVVPCMGSAQAQGRLYHSQTYVSMGNVNLGPSATPLTRSRDPHHEADLMTSHPCEANTA